MGNQRRKYRPIWRLWKSTKQLMEISLTCLVKVPPHKCPIAQFQKYCSDRSRIFWNWHNCTCLSSGMKYFPKSRGFFFVTTTFGTLYFFKCKNTLYIHQQKVNVRVIFVLISLCAVRFNLYKIDHLLKRSQTWLVLLHTN